MSEKSTIKPLAIAVGAAFVTSLASATAVNAAENPFAMSELSSGYMVAEKAEGKCGEGKMKEGMKMEGEGKCGEGKMKEGMKMEGEGKCGEGKMKEGMKTEGEGKCGEGKMKDAAGKMKKEGKCGEGKCGEGKK